MIPGLPHDRLTITVPEAGRWLGIGRDAAYRAAERGEIPTLRLGRRLVVPVPRLLQLVGASPETDEAGAPTPTIAHTDEVSGEPRHAEHSVTIHRIA